MNLIILLESFEKMLAEVKSIKFKEVHNITRNHDQFIDQLRLKIKFQKVGLHLGRAQKYFGNEKKIPEKDALFSVYCEIKECAISDADLKTAKLQDYTTGNNLTLAGVEQRLMQLGWKG